MRKFIPTLAVRMNRLLVTFAILFAATVSVRAQTDFGFRTQNVRSNFVSPCGYFRFETGYGNRGHEIGNPEPGTGNWEPADTTKTDTVRQKKHSPKTAAIMSACLPGLGQIYNKKYWKLAIIYPAMGGLGYGFAWNHQYFKYYRDALRTRYDGDSTTIDPLVNYSDDYIVTLKNYYQRYRDLCVIGFAAVYVLQVVDAAVDAHMFYFDVGPDLSMNWQPYFTADTYGPTTGVSFHVGFR